MATQPRPRRRGRATSVAARLANHDRFNREDSAGRAVLLTQLEVAKREDDVARLTADWPPLTPEQADALVAAIRGAVIAPAKASR